MRALVIIILATLVLSSGQAQASPSSDTSTADLQKKAAQGVAEAQANLGLLYYDGKGVPQNFATAKRWYEQAAMQGHAGAQNNLGALYEFGHGVKQDSVQAYMWYNVAASLSTDDLQKDVAAENRDEIAGDMTSTQISEAKRLTSQCRTRQFKGC
jgi:TPR repeat protein